MLGDVLTSVEVLREKARRHHQSRTDVRKAFARGTIDRKLASRVERRDAGQILDRVGVFGIRETAEHHWSWVASVSDRNLIERLMRPIEQHLLRGLRERLLLLRRHLATGDLFQH